MPNTNQIQRVLNDPNFYNLDPSERTKVLARLDPNFSMLPVDEQLKVVCRGVQPSSASQSPQAPQRSFLQRAYDALTWKPPNWPKQGYSEVPEGSGFTGVSTAADEVSHDLQDAATKQQTSNLTQTAKTGQQPGFGARTKRALLQTGADTTRMISGATSPTSQAIALGTMAAPEYAAPLLIGHGLYTGLSNAPDALRGNADAAEKSLGGFSEAAGGGAVAKGIIDDPSLTGFSRARRVLTPSDAVTYQRIISPNSTGAAAQLSDLETWNRARPYLSQESKINPVVAEQTQGPFAGQRLGVMNLRQNAQAAAKSLWEQQIEPRSQIYSGAPLEPTKVGVTAAGDIRSTTNPTESQLNPAKVASVQDLANFYDKPMTVGDALDRISELNNAKGVQAYEKALPDKQAELLKGDPTIEGKIAAANTMRDQVFDSIEKHGSPDEANYIREARKDYGALKDVGQNLGNAQVPTPQPIVQRIANSVRGVVTPSGLDRYLAQPLDTMLRMSAPNALAETLSRSLVDANLQPRQGPPIRPWNPAPFNTPPAGPMAPPTVPSQFARESVRPNQPQAIGRAGDDAIQVNTLPTQHVGEGDYAGLLPGPPATFVPPPPMPLGPQVGELPTLQNPTSSNPMWDGSATPGSGNVPVNQPGPTAALRGGTFQATAPSMNPPPPGPGPMPPTLSDA